MIFWHHSEAYNSRAVCRDQIKKDRRLKLNILNFQLLLLLLLEEIEKNTRQTNSMKPLKSQHLR